MKIKRKSEKVLAALESISMPHGITTSAERHNSYNKRSLVMDLKKIFLLFTAFLCAIQLTACYPNSETTVIESDINTISTDNEVSEENIAITNEMLKINVNLDETKNNEDEYAVITAQLKSWDDGVMQNTFINDKTVIEESEYEADMTPGTMHKNYSLENSWNLSYENGRVTFRNIDVNNERMYSYFADAAFWKENNEALNKTFGHNELSFMTSSDVQNITDNIINSLGIADAEIMGIYSMDASDVNNISETEDTTLKDGSEFEKWSADDEAYILIYTFKYDEMDIAEYSVNYQSRGFEGSYIMGIVNKDGLVNLNMQMIYDNISTGEKKKICSATAALNKITEKYENIILKNEIEVTDCKLNYVVVDKNDGVYTLSPVWTFITKENIDGADRYNVELVDALTEQILD